MKPLVLVTGDIVLDCHLYGGLRTSATSLNEPGTTYEKVPGGAALTYELLKAAADTSGRNWDAKRASALAKDLPAQRPMPSFEVHLGLKVPASDSKWPGQLSSYGVWGDRPAGKGSDDRVWRLARDYGYGPSEAIPKDGVFTPNEPSSSGGDAVLTVIDDGGIVFRNQGSKAVWPPVPTNGNMHFLLKMSPPLCRGDLWAELNVLDTVMSRLIVVVSSSDLRREDAQVSRRLSWEQCAESTLRALRQDPVVGQLCKAAHLIVNFQSGGALLMSGGATGSPTTRLIFDHLRLEDDFDREFDGTVYGFQTCVVVGIAHRLMAQHLGLVKVDQTTLPSPFKDVNAMPGALDAGLGAGLTMRRRLLELGHGPVEPRSKPGFPVTALGTLATESAKGFMTSTVPDSVVAENRCPWTVLAETELIGPPTTPLIGLAHQTAQYGFDALSHVPAFKLGKLFVVDRSEIESLRTLHALIRDYEDVKVQKKPLCIGVFGSPGSGKSFGVEALAEGILGEKVPFLVFNLSQFKGPDDLIGAFHRVRDAVLMGITPVAFWDEFDSQHYVWLQYLLAPMQDGAFQEGQVTHPIGKCLFVFAGGTSDTLGEFGVAEPDELTTDQRGALTGEARADRREEEEAYREFKRLKGPDFISRLHGFLNVLGVNPRKKTACPDITWPIRRALILRGMLKLKEREELDIDLGLLHALLSTPEYWHGARSLEKIVVSLTSGRDNGRLYRAALPPDPALARETDAAEFRRLMDTFKNDADIDQLAAAVHESFRDGAEASAVAADMAKDPGMTWKIDEAVMQDYQELPADLKTSNRAAALRVPGLLVLINFVVKRRQPGDDNSWIAPLEDAIEKHVDRLARAEHLGWCAERRASGWSYATERDNDRKHHPLLVDWSKLSESEREKDRHSARSISAWLKVAGFKAVQVSSEPAKTI
jgi:RyR domain-containing protein